MDTAAPGLAACPLPSYPRREPAAIFYFLSKTLDVALEPLFWCTLALALGARLLARGTRRRLALGLVSGGLLSLLALSTRPVAHGLVHYVETSALATRRPEVTYDAVVLLGGLVDFFGFEAGQPTYGDAAERLHATFEVLRTGGARYAIASGGGAFDGLPSEARVLVDHLASWGVEPERLLVEERAMNTHENAVEVARLARERGFTKLLVVTSAFHAPRAVGCFAAEGLAVDVLPVDYQMRSSARGTDWLPRARYLEQSSAALRELGGRLVYRAVGYAR